MLPYILYFFMSFKDKQFTLWLLSASGPAAVALIILTYTSAEAILTGRLTMCVIFTILVSFSRDNALFASKAKINIFWIFFKRRGPKGASGVKKIFQKMLI